MTDALSNFILSHFPIGGLAAYSVHLPHQLLEIQCLSKSLYPSTTEQMLTKMVQNGRTLLPAGERPVHYCWTYEAHRVYVAMRPDGFALALLVENIPTAQLVRVQETLRGFLDLTEV
jgi:hypothetical protein